MKAFWSLKTLFRPDPPPSQHVACRETLPFLHIKHTSYPKQTGFKWLLSDEIPSGLPSLSQARVCNRPLGKANASTNCFLTLLIRHMGHGGGRIKTLPGELSCAWWWLLLFFYKNKDGRTYLKRCWRIVVVDGYKLQEAAGYNRTKVPNAHDSAIPVLESLSTTSHFCDPR